MYDDLWIEFEKNGDVRSYLKYRRAKQASVANDAEIKNGRNCEKDTVTKEATDYATV